MAQQPIITGIQSVGSVSINYKYNATDGKMPINTAVIGGVASSTKVIDTGTAGVECVGFRLDSTFLDANPQIASSLMIPMLGGGAIALTNNNRSGTLTINTTRVSCPDAATGQIPAISSDVALGVNSTTACYDLTFLLQCQQAASGGDSVGSTLTITFQFGDNSITFQFLGCTVASIKPLALAGNDAVDYAASINYLNWTVNYNSNTALA